jgi:phosphate transport system substrate-binding protein
VISKLNASGRVRRKEWLVILLYLAVVVMTGGGMVVYVYMGEGERGDRDRWEVGGGKGEGERGDRDRDKDRDKSEDGGVRWVPVLAGTGTAIPVLQVLAEEFGRLTGGTVHIEPSIGSTGGIAALRDGRIDCALVSRELKPEEQQDVAYIPFALAPVVLAAGRDLPACHLDSDMLLALYSGADRIWCDGGAVTVLLRETGDSATAIFGQFFSGFADVHSQAVTARTWRVLMTDQAMEQALTDSPRAVGLFDFGIMQIRNAGVHSVPVAGLVPRLESGGSPSYPLLRPLGFAVTETPSGTLAEFITFTRGTAGGEMLLRYGYVPIAEPLVK